MLKAGRATKQPPSGRLVAHRGDQANAVENTLAAFQAAAQAGALFLECDIQFTRDFVPVILHDHSLKRPGLGRGSVSERSYAELLQQCGRHYPLLRFDALLQWLMQHPDITLFVEIKPPVLRRKSPTLTVQMLLALIPQAVRTQIILISQSALLVEACHRQFNGKVGWVATHQRVPDSDFDYLFLSADRAAEAVRWQQRGVKCAVYTVNDSGRATALLASGIDLVETNYFGRMQQRLANA